MVLFFTSCPTSSLVSQQHSTIHFEHPKSQPIPVSNAQWDADCDDSSSSFISCSLERFPSPLATSAESVNSIKSSCSSRSSAEREMERAQRRQLLNTSLCKLREEANMPLRKHLLIFNTVKNIQQDLDMLDDEELYCSLVGMSNDATTTTTTMTMTTTTTTTVVPMEITATMCMEVDEEESNVCDAADSAICGAPPKQEERGLSCTDVTAMMFGDDLEMDETETKTWSWSTGTSIFDSVPESKTNSMDALFKWSSSCSDAAAFSAPINNSFGGWSNSSPLGDSCFGLADDSTSSWSHGATGFDMWGASDPLGSARFDMNNLLLLQA